MAQINTIKDYKKFLTSQCTDLHNKISEFERRSLLLLSNIENNSNNDENDDDTIPISPINIVDIDEDLLPLINSNKLIIQDDSNYVVTHIFTTLEGSWDNNGKQFSIKQRFRDKFLKPMHDPKYIDDGGANRHLLVGLYDKNWNPIENHPVYFNTVDLNNAATKYTKRSGFANIEFGPSSAFWPKSGQSGYWFVTIPDTNLKVSGLGLINKWHVSIYIVIQKLN